MNSFDTPLAESRKALGTHLVEELNKKGYLAFYAADKNEAAAHLLSLIPKGTSVGIPGSVTIRQLGMPEKLAEQGCTVHQHWDPSLTPEGRKEMLMKEFHSDCFLTSANAVTRDGVLVSLDGTGNRVSAMAWGENTLIFVIGINKVVPDIGAAIERAHAAALPNILRLGLDTPCTKTGHCMDCSSPSRICRAMLILERPTSGRKTHVIIVGENLGY